MSELTLQEVVDFRKRVIESTKKFSVERQVFNNILCGYYDKEPKILEFAQSNINFLNGIRQGN